MPSSRLLVLLLCLLQGYVFFIIVFLYGFNEHIVFQYLLDFLERFHIELDCHPLIVLVNNVSLLDVHLASLCWE